MTAPTGHALAARVLADGGLAGHVADYLAIRRAVGFKLICSGRLLEQFAAFAARTGVNTVTIEIAVAWASLPGAASPVWHNQRLGVVRQFARYLHTVDPNAQVPPHDLLPGRAIRPTPYLYSAAEIAALIGAARELPDPLRAATIATVIGVLAVTGMRGGEVMRLDRADLDLDRQQVLVRETKFGKSRELPLHASTVTALREYAAVPRPALSRAEDRQLLRLHLRGAAVSRHRPADLPGPAGSGRDRPARGGVPSPHP